MATTSGHQAQHRDMASAGGRGMQSLPWKLYVLVGDTGGWDLCVCIQIIYIYIYYILIVY